MIRKINSKEEIDKKRQRNNLIIGIVLIGVMALSTLGYSFMGSEEDSKIEKTFKYNNHEFNLISGSWILELGNYQFGFKTKPVDANADISGNLKLLTNYEKKPLYISSKDSVATTEIYQNLGQLASRVQFACTSKEECKEDYPIKDCTNNFIIININESNSITQEQNCVYINAEKNNLINATDEFLYKIMGVK